MLLANMFVCGNCFAVSLSPSHLAAPCTTAAWVCTTVLYFMLYCLAGAAFQPSVCALTVTVVANVLQDLYS